MENESLRSKAVKGVSYLTARNAFMAVVGVVGTFFIARVLGPEVQGLYQSASAVYGYILLIILMKNTNYLIISKKEELRKVFNLIFSWHCAVGIPIGFIGALISWAISFVYYDNSLFVKYLSILFLSLPFSMLKSVFLSYLEKKLDFKKVSFVEALTQIVNYATAIPLVQLGFQGFSLPIAVLVSEFISFLVSIKLARIKPQWYLSGAALSDLIKVSTAQSVPSWIQGLEKLGKPLLILPIAGASAVAYAQMGERLISILSFPKGAIGRVSLPLLSAIQDDKERVNRVVNQSMNFQTFLIGLIYSLFALVGALFIPILLGEKWDGQVVLTMFAILATRSLVSTFTAIQGTALTLYKKNKSLIIIYTIYIVSYFASLSILIYVLPQESKVYAYGVAGILGVLATSMMRHREYSKHIGKPDYRLALIWSVAFVAAFFAPALCEWLYLITFALLLTPASRAQMKEIYKMLSPLFRKRLRYHSSGKERNTDSSTGNP